MGNASKAGDAIVVRCGSPGAYEITIIDGGTEESGTTIVEHVRRVYGADAVVANLVSTHPDSAPKDDEKHPKKMVLNAFTRRGAFVRSTQGSKYRFHSETMPARAGEKPATVFSLFNRVEAYD